MEKGVEKSKKKYLFWIWMAIGIIVFLGLIFFISVKQVSKIYLYVDQVVNGRLVFDPYGGDDLELKKGQEAIVALNYEPDKKLIFTKCNYDRSIIEYKNRTITAKKEGKTELICEIVLNGKVKSDPISVKVN